MANKILVTTQNPEEVHAAISAGADALTIPIDSYDPDLFCYAKIQGVQVYLACEQIVTNEDLSFFLRQISAAVAEGIDGIYLTDMGIAATVKEHIDIPIILSPHTRITNYESLKRFSVADVIILSPEITRDSYLEIKKRASSIGIVVHGTLDHLYSNQIKLQELSMYPYLEEFDNVVLTIFSNNKNPSDLYRIVSIYANNTAEAEEELTMTSKRALFSGIYGKRKPTKKGVFMGKVANGCLELQRDLRRGEQILIHNGRRGTFFKITYILKNKKAVEEAWAGDKIQLRYPHFKSGNAIYKTGLATVDFARKRAAVSLRYSFDEQGLTVTLQDKTGTVHATSSDVMKAERHPITQAELETKLCRINDSPFRVAEVSGDFKTDLFVSYSTINQVRNNAVEQLRALHMERFRRNPVPISAPHVETQARDVRVYVKANSFETALEALEAGADALYYDIFSPDVPDCQALCAKHNVPLYLTTPRIIQEKELSHIMKLIEHYNPDGILVGNPALLKVKAHKHLDSNFQIANTQALTYWGLPAITSHPIADERALLFVYGRPSTNTRFEVKAKGIVTPYGDTIIHGRHIDRTEEIATYINQGVSRFYLDLDENVVVTIKRIKLTN
ncbi:MAG: DUF3656 domain-containing U32 family peptidase [Nanobdellota archaeon]